MASEDRVGTPAGGDVPELDSARFQVIDGIRTTLDRAEQAAGEGKLDKGPGLIESIVGEPVNMKVSTDTGPGVYFSGGNGGPRRLVIIGGLEIVELRDDATAQAVFGPAGDPRDGSGVLLASYGRERRSDGAWDGARFTSDGRASLVTNGAGVTAVDSTEARQLSAGWESLKRKVDLQLTVRAITIV